MNATENTQRKIQPDPTRAAQDHHACMPSPLMVVYGESMHPFVASTDKLVATIFSDQGLAVTKLGDGRKAVTCNEIISCAKDHLAKNAHLLINVHGGNPGPHMVLVSNDIQRGMVTTDLLHDIFLSPSVPQAETTNKPALPVIHLTACNTKTLRKEFKPGTAEWKAGYVLLYTNNESSIEQYQSSLQSALTYIANCKLRAIECDPFKLFFLAGQNRGHCMTLLGGILEAPLVWHSPKNIQDLNDDLLFSKLKGSPADKAYLIASACLVDTQDKKELADHQTIISSMFANRISNNDVAAMRSLLKQHPGLLNQKSLRGLSPLSMAIRFQSMACAEELIAMGADINARDNENWTPLMDAAQDNHSKIIITLLSNRARINEFDEDGNTALNHAALHKNHAALKALLHYKANTHIANNKGHTALQIAIHNNDIESVKILVAKGAMPADRDSQRSLADLAIDFGYLEIWNLLRKA